MSFYKITHTKYIYSSVNNSKKSSSILNTNIHIFYIIFFINKLGLYTSDRTHTMLQPKIKFFFLPTKKRNLIFLRAPYKNKLARLNILQIRYKFFISYFNNNMTLPLNNLYQFFSALDFSSAKIKHIRTKVSSPLLYNANFCLANFN